MCDVAGDEIVLLQQGKNLYRAWAAQSLPRGAGEAMEKVVLKVVTKGKLFMFQGELKAPLHGTGVGWKTYSFTL